MKMFEQRDRRGQALKAGDRVRIIGLPDLSGMHPECLAESLPIFEFLLGKYKRIRDFDEYGFAEISFKIHTPNGWDHHTVWLEPYFLQLPQSAHLSGEAYSIFKETGFLAASEGPTDLSENYKQYLDFQKTE